MVRDWIDTTVGEAKRHLANWFKHQRIVDAYGAEAVPLGIRALAEATVRDPSAGLAPGTSQSLIRGALQGHPLPMSLLYRASVRNRAGREKDRTGVMREIMPYPRAALIKLVLASQQLSDKEDTMVQLDRDNLDPAYRCGRLLALLERTQQAALGDVNASLVDRFYGTASSAPGSVFGLLVRGAQAHLGKLQNTQSSAYWAIQKELEEVLAGISAFPRTLDLVQQGLFALGYYHQRAYGRAQAQERRRERESATTDAGTEE